MRNLNYTAELLNLKYVVVTKVENFESEVRVYIELPRREHICPVCGAPTYRVHDYREQIIKDIPLGRTTYLYLKKRRYRCSCGKRFYEDNTFLPRYYRTTSRMIAEIIQEFRKLVSATEVASRYSVSMIAQKLYETGSMRFCIPLTFPRQMVLLRDVTTKVLKRVCFGVHNFRRFRNRIIHCSS